MAMWLDPISDDGWQVPPDGHCLVCEWPYRYEMSDAREYQRFCCGDCERAWEREGAGDAHVSGPE